jgi:2'-5' RNA ligase
MSGSATVPESMPEPSSSDASELVEFFALIAYLPEPIATFLSVLRHQLDPGFRGRPHLTILPPRPLANSPQAVWSEVQQMLASSHPIEVGLGEVETFSESHVIFLRLNAGAREIEVLHQQLNRGKANFRETWEFHPHVTLAHGVCAEKFQATSLAACAHWAEYCGPRRFPVEQLDWVKTCVHIDSANVGKRGLVRSDSEWVDLTHWNLGAPLR